jgi:D-3-phosphoglycerate dehydrogenase
MKKKIIVTDGISENAKKMLESKYIVDLKKGLPPEELKKEIKNYNAIIIRSATKMTAEIIEASENLEVIGRAGVGVDNVDVKAATKKGIVVVNAPGSNSVSVAEHAIGQDPWCGGLRKNRLPGGKKSNRARNAGYSF